MYYWKLCYPVKLSCADDLKSYILYSQVCFRECVARF